MQAKQDTVPSFSPDERKARADENETIIHNLITPDDPTMHMPLVPAILYREGFAELMILHPASAGHASNLRGSFGI
jgi:hypothetical protein